ncbi:MAG: glycosyltransferase family 39 protein, partial [Candidatus Zixiibacteriota bacterium]
MRFDFVKNKKEFFYLIFLFLFSFALRLIYLLQMQTNPHFNVPTMDPLYHDVWAQNIASGNWFGSSIFFRAPFYPYFLALVYKLFGHGYFIPRLIQHVVGSFSCILVYLLAKKLYNRTTAIISSLIAATYGILIY